MLENICGTKRERVSGGDTKDLCLNTYLKIVTALMIY